MLSYRCVVYVRNVTGNKRLDVKATVLVGRCIKNSKGKFIYQSKSSLSLAFIVKLKIRIKNICKFQNILISQTVADMANITIDNKYKYLHNYFDLDPL